VFVALSVLVVIFNSFTGYANLVKQTNQQVLQNKETSLSISGFSFGTPTVSNVGTSNTGNATAYSLRESCFTPRVFGGSSTVMDMIYYTRLPRMG